MNSLVYKIALGGGLFAVLAFIHFASDFILQSHSEAMIKHNHPKVRAKHCAIYTISFLPILYLFGFSWWEYLMALNVLFWSHFYLDTYHAVFLWAKHIRRPPEMKNDPKAGFVQFIQTTLGKILMIAIDQLSHLTFLFPVVYLAMRHI